MGKKVKWGVIGSGGIARRRTIPEGLTKADISWHAVNTYGWDCEEVISKDEITSEDFCDF